MNAPRISILLPIWNGERHLQQLLPALAQQDLAGECEIVAIDSSSTDASLELLKEAGARVETIPQSEFGHGTTRNRLAALARGDVFVFLSQDALPAGPEFLRELIRPLELERVAGAFGRILPHSTDDALTARTVLSAPEASAQERCLPELSSAEIWKLPGDQRVEHLRFNNVASAVRADVFRATEFPVVPFGEDLAWAARAIEAGWRVRYAPLSLVYHAHRYNASQAFERYRLDAAFHREIHSHLLRPSLSSALKGFLYEMGQDLRFVSSSKGFGWGDLWRSPGLRGAQVLGQFWGSRGWGKDFWPLVDQSAGASSR